jgi:hypothetical protein
MNDFLQDKVNKAKAKGCATYKLKERDSIELGLGTALMSEELREWGQREVDVARVSLAGWVESSPQETYHFAFTPLKSCLLEARAKVKVFKEADEAVLRFEKNKKPEQRDEEKLEDLSRRIASWVEVEAKLSQFDWTLKHQRQNGMSLDELEHLFQAVMEKAEKLMYPEITSEQNLGAIEMEEVCQALSTKLNI